MTSRQAAMKAGLVMPTRDDCLKCHKEKGSHTRVLNRPPMDMAKAWDEIAHPTPDDWVEKKLQAPALPVKDAERGRGGESERGSGGDEGAAAKYTGVAACAECHTGYDMGLQFSRWRESKHARAYADLGTPRGYAIAKEMKIAGDPQTNAACLKCHATAYVRPAAGVLERYSVHEGVGCEACHGPGSQYSAEAGMKDKARSQAAGLKKITPETCLACHADAHGKPFDYAKAVAAIAHPTHLPPPPAEVRYKTPLSLALRPGGGEVYVTCEAAYSAIVVDPAAGRKVAEIPVGGLPTSVAFSPDGRRAYVSNRLDDSVSVIDADARKVVATVPAGHQPHGLLTDRSGKHLFVLNTMSDDISVIDTASLKEVKRLSASRGPWDLALSPDGSRLFATNMYSRFVPYRRPSVSEVTVIDVERAVVEDRIVVPGANLMQGVAWHPSGKYALVTLLRTKNVVPMTRMMQGWTITNGLGIVWADRRVDQVLLDEPGMCFPDPIGLAVTADGRYALVTSSGTDRVAVVDLAKLIGMLEAADPRDRQEVFPNHLGKATEFVVAHIPTKDCPRTILIMPDGKTALVANSLDDSLTVIDVPGRKAVGRIDLGGPKEITKIRYGERLFHSAKVSFRRQLSCHSCHPDGHVDGLTYDIEEDGPRGGIGKDPVDNRTLRGILDTAPFKWSGINPSLSKQCGPRLSVFFTRLAPFTPEQLSALDTYICTIPRPPNRYRPVGAPLTEAQRRGRAIFYRTTRNDGSPIPKQDQCATCHFPPLYTDRNMHDVGTRGPFDSHAKFDVPHLNNIYDSAPYLHDGKAATLEEIWTRYNPDDKHGVTNDMTKDQLNDLVEYLKTL
jgi:YVTN family beta-propeller protein